ncbi:hypothetical protein BC830DRAFT_677074 [Chytriomyces sp. MP71]|nr:hypothetical protein BC830DRAFT_677074 [Chytriomyces sp. MP71]
MDGLRDQNETIEAKLRDAEASLKDFADVKHRLKDELKCLSAEKEMLEVRVGVLEAKLAEAVEVTEVRGREMTLLLAKKDEDARECEFKLEESLEKQRDAETRILELEAQLRNTNELLEDIQGTHETALAAQTAIADVCRHKLAESEALAREWGDALQRAETEAVRAQVVHERAVAEAREEVEHAKAMVSKLEGRVAEITADLETAQDKCNAILIDKADMWDAQIRKVQESLRAAESEKVKVKMAGDTECEKLQRMLEEKERDLVEVEALVRPLFGWMERLTESRKSAEE